ncbi:Ppx/GppA family phosphatase [Sphingorhabdus sp. 109]|uniref:Ppx/GppA family phosphatase n=1 Tax=Sphingorhabdus sp. 109 TaxID=2653173 RepID=UPI0012F3C681|nr:Ppx/GppA family phosphatase [Sphingorhabdus sp. 109]VWX56453.1 Guanosine-5'-triphosphate,3'-diphosphate pyrophosphatase [Sphingorhabdus sp. 109]
MSGLPGDKNSASGLAQKKKRGSGRRTAIVDIGSNSIRLVVYQGPARVPAILFNEKVMAGLGKELSTTGAIGKDSIALATRGMKRFYRLCIEMDVDNVQSFATAAVRDASNGKDLLNIASEIGYDVAVLQGEEEAELAALGVISGIPDASGIVGDLGGGSLELAMVDQGRVLERFSFPLGVLRVADLRAKGQDALKSKVRKMLKKTGWDKQGQDLPFYLVGGSWRSLARLDMFDSQYPLPVIHNYEMEPRRARRLVSRLAQLNRDKLKNVPGLSTSRIPTLKDAAWLLSLLVRYLNSSKMVVSAYGVREGMLFHTVSKQEAARDPLLLATEDTGAAQARFPANSKLLGKWIADIFSDDPVEWHRIRQAACNLGDVAWRANPNFRAERGLEVGLHGNWVGITGPEREMLGQALFTSFGGGNDVFPGGGKLASAAATRRAIAWGLAMRLGQRLSGGTRTPLEQTQIRKSGKKLELTIAGDLVHLYGDVVAKRHGHLANMLGLEPVMTAV